MTAGPPQQYPPPGAPPPAEPPGPPPAYGPAPTPGPPAYGAAPPPGAPYPTYAPVGRPAPYAGFLGAAHKPGAIPLRPLSLGNMYDAAFRIIRFNPRATVGAALLVTAVAMVLPVALSTVLQFTVGTGLDASGEDDLSTAEAVGLLGSFGSFLLGTWAAQLGLIFVTGMVAHVTHAAAVGRRLSLGEAWAATRGKRWRLLGLSLLVGLAVLAAVTLYVLVLVAIAVGTDSVGLTVLAGLGLGLPLLAAGAWLGVRLSYLASPALMLEPVGVFGAMGRNWTLTRRQFWRTFGISLLTTLIASVAASLLTTPISVVGQLGPALAPEYAGIIFVLTQAIALIVQNSFVAPFSAAVASLQYLDQRMRKEAYDVELMREAGIVAQ